MQAKKFCQKKNLLLLKFSETCSENSFSLEWHKNIDHPACDLIFDLQLTLTLIQRIKAIQLLTQTKLKQT